MGADQNFDFAGAVASTLDWWRDAGVDTLVENEVRDWLAPPPAAAPVVSPDAVAAVAAPAPAALPDNLAAFLAWRTGADAPEAGWPGASIAATGPADADIMIFVDCPDREDGDDGRLLSGAPGALFDRMLTAIGLSRDMVHLAALCVRRPTTGRAARDLEQRLGEIARHHIGLVAPKRLLLLGDAPSRAILGTDRAQAGGLLRQLNHRNGLTEAVASFHPRFLIGTPAAKAQAWKDLQILMGDMR